MRIPFASHPPQYLIESVSLILAILMFWKKYLIVVFICLSLKTNDIEHFCICFLAIYVSIFVKCPNLLHIFLFLIVYFCLLIIVISILGIFCIQVLCQINILRIFSPSLWLAYSFS